MKPEVGNMILEYDSENNLSDVGVISRIERDKIWAYWSNTEQDEMWISFERLEEDLKPLALDSRYEIIK